ncbi:hypothetical protein EsDP_00004569 [Epichloe bromicola]|uniref:Protein kinase domain-containing protein n=1 Tax=Epichloe bromicola TaxID=79588 RepID=A0ABQ0CS50_9HYPO
MSNNSPDYKKLFEQEKRRREQAEERQRRAEDDVQRRREQAEEQQRRAEDNARRLSDRIRNTTFLEFLHQCHTLLSLPLKADDPSRSTTGSIPPPTGKYCPTRLRPWVDCPALHQEIYDSVYRFLQPPDGETPCVFSSRSELEGLSRRIRNRPISSEPGLEMYERFAVDHHVADIIDELCKIPAAREKFRLGGGVRFDNHKNSLEKNDDSEESTSAASQPSRFRRPKPDQFCINVVDDTTDEVRTAGEYKAPHKLSMRTIRSGLRPMDVWNEMVASQTTPTDEIAKVKYNAERLVCSAIVQQFHVMIQEGLEVSYLTNGFCDIHLWVPRDDPGTLHYYLCEPNSEVDPEDRTLLEPRTAIARRLCLYLLSCGYPIRSQEWRAAARRQLRTWQTSFDDMPSQIPEDELRNTVPQSDTSDTGHKSSDSNSDYQPSSPPPIDSPTAEARRVRTRSQACNASQEVQQHRAESPDSSGSDTGPAAVTQRKRSISQVSTSVQTASRQRHFQGGGGNSPGRHDAKFCSLHCLLGLQRGDALDDNCPNVRLHQQDKREKTHPITGEQLVRLLEGQLGRDLDRNCTPFGHCGGSGAPFKLTCATYGYTVVGKGTTTDWWPEVAREADAYRVLKKVQASAVPVFLGTIDIPRVYFLHGAGEIRHMLVMGWGGESLEKIGEGSEIRAEIKRSVREIQRLGVIHGDLRRENMLWNTELRRILIIDFHRSKMIPQRATQQKGRAKRPSGGPTGGIETRQPKRLRLL